MHGLQACLFKYITVAAILIYAQHGEDATWKNHGIVFLNFCGKPNIIFEFLLIYICMYK